MHIIENVVKTHTHVMPTYQIGTCYRDTPFAYIDTPPIATYGRHPPHIGLVAQVAVTKHSKIVQATRAHGSEAAASSLTPSATTTSHILVF